MLTAPKKSNAAHASQNSNDSFFKTRVQTKLAIGKPGDKYEVEADRTADSVVSKLKEPKPQAPQQPTFFAPKPVVQAKKQETVQPKETAGKDEEIQEKPLVESITPLVQMSSMAESCPIQEKCADCEAKERESTLTGTVQKKCSKCEHEEKTAVQTKCADCEAKEKQEALTGEQPVQQKCDKCEQEQAVQTSKTGGGQSSGGLSGQLSASKGKGVSMDGTTQAQMGESFGTDFSNVKIHTGEHAVQMNRQLGSQAFANGKDIYFNEGKYNPGSDSGKHLLAHELTHTIQQGAVTSKIDRKAQESPTPQKDVAASIHSEPVKKEQSADNPLATGASDESKTVSSGVQEQIKKQVPADAQASATAVEPVKKGAYTTAAIAAASQKGDHVIGSVAPKEGKDKKQKENLPGKADKDKAGAAGNAKKALGTTDKKKGKKKTKRGKVVDAAAAVNAEFHPLPPLASLLQQPKEQEKTPSEDPTGKGSLVQMKPGDSPNAPTTTKVTPEVFIARINAASQANSAAVTTHAANLAAETTRKSEALKFSIYSTIQDAILQTHTKFIQAKADLGTSVSAMEATLNTNWSGKVKETIAEGQSAKQEIRGLFSNHLLNIDKAVNDNVQASQNMKSHYTDQVNLLVGEQITRARKKRDSKIASFPNSEKGQKQGAAVAEVANGTIQDMAERKPSVVEAISGIIQPIPEEYRKKGVEAKSGVTDHQTSLLNDVDTRIQEVIGQLREAHQSSLTQLRSYRKDMQKELQDQETYTVHQLEGLLPGVDQQITTATRTSLDGLEATKTQIVQQITIKAQEAIGIVSGAANPDQASMEAFCTTIVSFLNGISTESTGLMSQGIQSMEEETQTLSGNVNASVAATASATDQMIATFSRNATTALAAIESGHTQNMDTAFNAMTKGFSELTGKIKGQFDTAIQKLAEGFTKTLNDAEVKIIEAVNGGLAKNEEALSKLDGQMNEAASDAAWRYDNPVKAALLDIGSFIGGLVVGILLVLALVVVFIVAFQLLLAGLVALGCSLAVAQMIVLVAGLALLAYGIYRNYSTRTANGQGGWAALGMSVLDVVGITSIYRGFTEKGLSPFERGFLIGEGIATIASFFLARKIDSAISSRMPAAISNPGGVGVSGVRSPGGGGSGNSGGGKVIELFPRGRVPEPTPGSPGAGGSPRAVVTRGGALRQLAPEPEIIPLEVPKPGIVIPFPRQNPVAATPPAPGTPNPLIGTGASAGVNPATAPARRNANQTCDDQVLNRLQREKDEICNSIPTPNCSTALDKLKSREKLKGSRVIGISREHIRLRIAHVNRCIEKRQEIQETCFGGIPDDAHKKAIQDLKDGIAKCEELLELADSLSDAEKAKLLPSNW